MDNLFISNFRELTGNFKNAIKIIQKILIFTILVIILDFLVGSGLDYLFFKQKVGLYARTTYGLEKTTADLLIFGSSSAIHHYNPSIFEDTLKLTAYNQGRDGIDILYHSAILKGILTRYYPKIVILNLSPYELSTALSYDRLAALLPYCDKHPEMKKIVSLKSKFETWKLYSKIYPYNSTFLTIINGFKGNDRKRIEEKGYVPLFNSIDTNNFIKEDFSRPQHIDPNRVNALSGFIDDCKRSNTSVYLIFSPVFSFDKEFTETTKVAMGISKEKGVACLNFMNDPRFKGQASFFQDNGHMNHAGATRFSKIVAGYIIKDMQKGNH